MGMFDDIRCKYPLPEGYRQFQELLFQTKDTPSQFCDLYEIREDGTLMHEAYDTEDQSKRGIWMKENPGKPEPDFGIEGFFGCMSRVNKRWEPVGLHTGEIRFYNSISGAVKNGWVEFSAYYIDGKLQSLTCTECQLPEPWNGKATV